MKSNLSKPLPLAQLVAQGGLKAPRAEKPDEKLSNQTPVISHDQALSNQDSLINHEASVDSEKVLVPSSNYHFDGAHFELIDVDVDLIDPNPTPPRFIYTSEMLENMAQSLSDNGQLQAILICKSPSDPSRYVIGEGWTRVQAVKLKGILGNKLKAVYYPDLTPLQISHVGWITNNDRNPATDFDKFKYISSRPDTKGLSIRKLSAALGLTPSLIHRLLCFEKLHGEVLEFCKEHPYKITSRPVYLLLQIQQSAGHGTALQIAKKFAVYDESYSWLENQEKKFRSFVASAENKPSTPATASLKRLSFGSAQYRVKDDGQVLFQATIHPDHLDAVNKILTEAFEQAAKLGGFIKSSPGQKILDATSAEDLAND